MAARARGSYEDSMKDARSTHEYRTTYLLPLVSERIFSFPLFHSTKRRNFYFFFFSKLDEEPRRETVLLIDPRTRGPISMCSTSEIRRLLDLLVFPTVLVCPRLFFLNVISTFLTKDSIYTQSLNICGKS